MLVSAINNTNYCTSKLSAPAFKGSEPQTNPSKGTVFLSIDELLAMRQRYFDALELQDRLKRMDADYAPESKKGRESELINLDLMDEVVPNARLRTDSLLSGQRLDKVANGVETAKAAGIKTIVAFPGAASLEYENAAKKAGLNYIECFDYLPNKMNDEIGIVPFLNTKEDVDSYVNDVVEFLDIVNGRNPEYPLPVYMGCKEGVCRTNYAACLNYVFSPENRDMKCPDGSDNAIDAQQLRRLYRKLTPENKAKLGITKDNEYIVKARLAQINY